MPKGTSKSNFKNHNKSSNKTTANSKLNSHTLGRPRPMAPKAGVTVERRRYGKGGGWC